MREKMKGKPFIGYKNVGVDVAKLIEMKAFTNKAQKMKPSNVWHKTSNLNGFERSVKPPFFRSNNLFANNSIFGAFSTCFLSKSSLFKRQRNVNGQKKRGNASKSNTDLLFISDSIQQHIPIYLCESNDEDVGTGTNLLLKQQQNRDRVQQQTQKRLAFWYTKIGKGLELELLEKTFLI